MTEAKLKVDKPKRNFILVDSDGNDTTHSFTGRIPRQAALKAVNSGYTKFGLREAGEIKIHLFEGSINWVPAPEKLPSWVKPRPDGMVKKPVIKKCGISHPDQKKRK